MEPNSNAVTIYNASGESGIDQGHILQQLRNASNIHHYTNGFAICSQFNTIDVENKGNHLEGAVEDVAERMDPSTVTFTCVSDPDLKVYEQSFQFDVIDKEKVLAKFLDQEVKCESVKDNVSITGVLKSFSNGYILQLADGRLELLPKEYQVTVPGMPPGLRTKPTLEVKLSSQVARETVPASVVMKTSYKAKAFQWATDYNIVLNKDNTLGDLTAWVAILNGSGKSFKNTKVKLVAGDVNTVQEAPPPRPMVMAACVANLAMDAMEESAFKEEEFFEYHMYTLPFKTDLNNCALNQLALFPPVKGMKVEKILSYQAISKGPWTTTVDARRYGGQPNDKVDVKINFQNEKDNQLGVPLPKGKVRVFQEMDGVPEFVGEDKIKHTPRNSNVSVKLGNAFDVKGKREVVNLEVKRNLEGGTLVVEEVKLKIKNHKEHSDVNVRVREPLYRYCNYKITESMASLESSEQLPPTTHEYDIRTDPSHAPDTSEFGYAVWNVKVVADQELTILYKVVYDIPAGVPINH